jgi:uncharacterized protein (DUF885 family)
MDDHTQFTRFLADDWEARMQADPLFATFTGDNRFNDRLPAISETWYENWLASLRGLEKHLNQFEREALSPADRLNYDIYARLLTNEIGLLEFNSYRMPVSKAGGFHMYFPDLYLQVPLATTQDHENYISRLAAFRQYAEGHIELMRTGIREGQIPPRVTIDGVAENIRPLLVDDLTQSIFYKPFEAFPSGIPTSSHDRLKQDCLKAIRESILPGYTALLRFILDEYMPAARTSTAAADLPNGADYYRLCIRHFTSLDLSPEEVHQTGLEEVKRIQAEMQSVMHQVGFVGDFKAFLDFLRSDPRFYVTTPEALLEKTALVLKRMDGELPGMFKTLPRLPYGIRAIPDFSAPGNTAAYYSPGAGDGSRAGNYYVNTYDLKSRPLYEIEALSLHEAVPGHHLQIALQQELDLPSFRRFNGFTSFVEGWALYSEILGLEVGFYTDPYSNFGRLSYEMWRACRLVVDTGLHALGWTRRRAIDFMADHTSSTMLNIRNEVDRYIAWPGQALAYKIGELKIRSLRQAAELNLGERFDLRLFHDVVLTSGAVPLDILETLVMDWIANRR